MSAAPRSGPARLREGATQRTRARLREGAGESRRGRAGLRWRLPLALLLVAACDRLAPEEPEPAGPSLTVTRGELEPTILLTGELEAANSLDLSVPRTESWNIAIRWMAEDGAEVKVGDKVVELDNTAVLERISDHDLAVVQADIELTSQQAKHAVELADKRFEVESQRIALEKAALDAEVSPELVSRRDYQEFKIAKQRAKVALTTAEDDLATTIRGGKLEEQVKRIALQKAVRQYEGAREQLKSLVLTAPRDGVAMIATHPWEGRKFQVGDTVWPGMAVAKLPDLETMLVKGTLSDVDDGRIRAGMRARCTADAYPDQPVEAVVVSVSPVAREPERQSARRFFSVILELEQTDHETMRPGLSVKVEIFDEPRPDALLVPRAAVDFGAEAPQVTLASGEQVEVALGTCTPQHCALLGGLDEGAELRPAGGSR